MCRPPGSAWRGGARLRWRASSRSSGAIRWPGSPRAPRRFPALSSPSLPRLGLAVGAPGLGHLVGVGRAADQHAGAAVPLFRLYRARLPRPSARADRRGSWRSSGWSGRSIFRSSTIRCCGGIRSTSRRASPPAARRWPAPFLVGLVPATLGFTLIFGGVVLARMRALLAEVQAEARLRRKAFEG